MNPASLYTELHLALDNKTNIGLIRSIQDASVVIVGRGMIPIISLLPKVYNELDLPLESIQSIIVLDKVKTKARKVLNSLDLPEAFSCIPISIVSELDSFCPPVTLTIVITAPGTPPPNFAYYAYGITIILTSEFNCTHTRDSLSKLRFITPPFPPEQSEFCKTRLGIFKKLMESGDITGAFYHALEELKSGCDECNLCTAYGSDKSCPFFQLKVAEFYDERLSVPNNKSLALEWKKKAARQGFKEAELSLAGSYLSTPGCKNKQDDIFSLLTKHAALGDQQAVQYLIDYAQKTGKNELAIPWYARMANAGDWEAQNKIINVYALGNDVIAPNNDEEKRWTDIALASGNSSFVADLAQKYADNEDWEAAFKWYNMLRSDDDFDEDYLLELFDNFCEGAGMTSHDYVKRGDEYYYGFDAEENHTLAYFCFKKAHELFEARGTEGMARCLYYGRGVPKDRKAAIDYYNEAAEQGEIKSMVSLFDYYSGEGNDKDLAEYWKKTAVIALDDAVTNEDPTAMRLKSLKMYKGALYDKNEEYAFELLQKAADMGDILAQFYLGQYYCHGTGVPVDHERAFDIFKVMSGRGLAIADRCIGCCYRSGYHVKKDTKQSFEWYLKAANRGDSNACYFVGLYYENGIVVDKNLSKANEWYLKAAEDGYKSAQTKLGENYYHGWGVKRNLSEAKKWSVLAAEQGDTDSFFRAAYLCGEEIDGVVEYDKTIKWYTYLSDHGNASAKNNLAICYAYGDGVPKDQDKASALYLAAAQGGDRMAMSNIASRYLSGTGVDVDYQQALEWFTKGLQRNSAKCGISLADEYISGEHFGKDISKGIEVLKKVLEFPRQNQQSKEFYIEALLKLADLYFYGKDNMAADNEKAFFYYKKAAQEGNAQAYDKLGTMYQYGYYVDVDIDQAIYWYRLAAEKNNDHAIKQLETLDPHWQKNKQEDEPVDELPF